MKLFWMSFLVSFALVLVGCNNASSKNAQLEKDGSDWTLSSKASHIGYVTIKQGDIAEANRFSIYTGTVSALGDVDISIALNSVETNVDTRDERMKNLVFKTNDFPMAEITTSIPMESLTTMSIGARQSLSNEIAVSLAGLTETFDVDFMVTRLGANSVLIESKTPVLVQASDFGLEAGVAELQKLANLDSITPVVPVSFSLVFKR